MIGTGEVYLVLLSIGLTPGSPLESTNPRDIIGSLFGSLAVMILGMSIGNPWGCPIDSIGYINCCGTLYQCLSISLEIQLGPFFAIQFTWHLGNDWHTDGGFTWKLDGQVS